MADIPKFVPADASAEELAKRGVPYAPLSAPVPPAQAPTVEPAAAQSQLPGLTGEGPQASAEPTTAEPVMGELIPPEEQTPEERAEVARMAANVNLVFPAVGFIEPEQQLEQMLRITQQMPAHEKAAYPDKIRAAILAHEAGKGPEVTDEELALAIFIQRTTATPLTEEELEAKATGRKKRDPSAPPKAKKNMTKAEKSLEQLKALGF